MDLMKLTDKIVDWFYADGFAEVRKDVDNETFTVQARKAGKLRTLTSTRKVLTIVIKGTPNDFHVSVGTGEWGKGVAVAVVLTGVIGVVGLGFNAAFREKVWSNIKSIVSSLENSNSVSTSSISSKEDKPLDILKKRFALGEITKEEFEDMKLTVKNLEFYDCKDFLEMASIIKTSKIFIGNSTIGIDIAEGIKSPRLLEASPYFPARQIHGDKAYDFYFQAHFEKFFQLLYKN